jgi:predicted AlkP superfamily pyrophosphatase or phosphodiesterase
LRLRRRTVVPILLAAVCLLAAAGRAPRTADPIVLLVSMDGWRWDYFDRAATPTLHALAARGVRSEGLIPPFPSKTYPSHYTIVTGLYPAHHGIISNNMWDDTIGERFTMQAPTSKDPRWWGGEPIWATAVKQGRRAASMFWPGADVEIGGVRPTEWKPYDDYFPNDDRVKQVLVWLALPEERRPSFVTLYFSDVDTAAHAYGPDAPETLAAATKLDGLLGAVVRGIEAQGLADRTTVIVVSDHGLSQQALDRKIFLDDYVDPATVNVVDWSPVLHVAPKTGTVDALYAALHGRHPHLTVYRREEIPGYLHYAGNPRIQPIIALADDGWAITTHARFEQNKDQPNQKGGEHGYDGRYQSMHGLFVAAGPSLRHGVVVPEFESVHLYDLMCRILRLKPAWNDGDPQVTELFMGSTGSTGSAGSAGSAGSKGW